MTDGTQSEISAGNIKAGHKKIRSTGSLCNINNRLYIISIYSVISKQNRTRVREPPDLCMEIAAMSAPAFMELIGRLSPKYQVSSMGFVGPAP